MFLPVAACVCVQIWQDQQVDSVRSLKKWAAMVMHALQLDTEGQVLAHVQLRKELINLQCEEHILEEMLRRNREAQRVAEAEDAGLGGG
jgi:hypothetical protein